MQYMHKTKQEMKTMTINEMILNSNGAIHVRYYDNGCDIHTKDERR